MLSIEGIIEVLCPKQEIYLKKSNKETDYKDYKTIENIFNGERYIYTEDNNIDNCLANYLSTVLSIIDESFLLNEKKFKLKIINELINKMINDYDIDNHYYVFKYNKNKKIKKTLIQEYLYNYLNNIKINDISILQQYISDYFSLNIFILYKNDKDIIESKFISSKRYENKINKYLPTLCIYKHESKYYPIYNKNMNDSIILYSKYKDLLFELYNTFKIFIEEYKYKKKTLSELKDIVLSKNLKIKKKSKFSNREIFLKKDELLDLLRIHYNF